MFDLSTSNDDHDGEDQPSEPVVQIITRDMLLRTPLYSFCRAILALKYGMRINGHRLTFDEIA